MAIKYTQILNSFVSTEGSNGIMTNYIYYSVLVVHTNGMREIVEGKYASILHLMPYVRMPQDEIEELRMAVKDLRQDMDGLINEKIDYLVDSLYPIPDIRGMAETEAVAALEKAGLIPVPVNKYPEGTPKNGKVKAYQRNRFSFRQVDLNVIHDIPGVTGLTEENARMKLDEAGFAARVSYRPVREGKEGIVLRAGREDETSLNIQLEVSRLVPDVTSMKEDDAVQMLKEKGFRVRGEKIFVSSGETGNVREWKVLEDNSVGLKVTAPERVTPREVTIEWFDLPESTGDEYEANAMLEAKKKEILVIMHYQVNTRVKHQLTELLSMKPSYSFILVGGQQTLEPGEKGELRFRIRDSDGFRKLPNEISFSLETKYGIMKKEASVPMKLILEW